MTRRRTDRCPQTLDLLDWIGSQPPRQDLVILPDEITRRNSFYARHIGVMKLALHDRDRETVAAEMSGWLGETVTATTLNAAVSEARTSHILNSVRYGALVRATQDARLVAVYADPD